MRQFSEGEGSSSRRRAHGRWFIARFDLAQVAANVVKPGQQVIDTFRIRRRAKFAQQVGHVTVNPEFRAKRPCPGIEAMSRRENRPDSFGHYPKDPRALPPGLDNASLITIAHVVDGEVIGGFTWAIQEKNTNEDSIE